MDKPSFLRRLFFWIVLGMLSTFFAEVLSGAAPFVFFTQFGYIGIIPLYTLHILVLASLSIRPKRPLSIRTLYLFSTLFGMYEAYITKVLWDPQWGPDPFKIGGVALIALLELVLFWHAYMSFLIPLFITENLLADSTKLNGILTEKIRCFVFCPFFSALVGIFGGIMLSMNLPDAHQSAASAILSATVATVLISLWTLFTGKKQYHLVDLLPNPAEAFILGMLLCAYYIFFGFNLRIEFLPGIKQQATIWLIYAILIALILFSVRKDRLKTQNQERQPKPLTPPRLDFKHWLLFAAAFIFSAPAFSFLPETMHTCLTTIAFYGCMFLGILTFVFSFLGLFRKNKIT